MIKIQKYTLLFVLCTLGTKIYTRTDPREQDAYAQKLVHHVKQCIEQAERHQSKLTPQVLAVPGMTSHKVKHFLNNLCSFPGASYLEIGVWKGATFTAALYKNNNLARATAVDNWSLFGGPKNEFHKNCKTHISDINYKFFDHDSFTLNLRVFDHPVDIYFYDGDHKKQSQERAFTYYDSVLAPVFVAVIDDYNWQSVRKRTGTKMAFEQLNYTVLFEQELLARFNGDVEQWWNGLYVAVIKKNTKSF